jgi:hypothetical protein
VASYIPTDENRKAALEARKAASKAKALDIAPIINEIEQALSALHIRPAVRTSQDDSLG